MEEKKFSHQMLKEIFEQSDIIKKLFAQYIIKENGGYRIKNLFDKILIKDIKRITFIGSGSSSYAAIYGNYLSEEILGLPCEYEYSDEFISRDKVIEPGTAVIALSQSGETGDVIEAAAQAKQSKALVIGISNNKDSSLAELADIFIDISAGPEIAMAATKTFLAELASILLLVLYWAQTMDKKLENIIYEAVLSIPEKIANVLQLAEQVKKLAKEIVKNDDIVILGRKYSYPIALEGAHKLKEVTYMHAEGYAAEEFRHGSNAIIEEGYIIFMLAPDDSVFNESKKILKQLNEYKAKIVTLTNVDHEEINNSSSMVLQLPIIEEMLNPFLFVIPFQLLSYYIARERGIDIDKPRNLKKFIAN